VYVFPGLLREAVLGFYVTTYGVGALTILALSGEV
jgi:hypothetical protein